MLWNHCRKHSFSLKRSYRKWANDFRIFWKENLIAKRKYSHMKEHSANCDFYYDPVYPMRSCHGFSIRIWKCPYFPSVLFYWLIWGWQCVRVEFGIAVKFVRVFSDTFVQAIQSKPNIFQIVFLNFFFAKICSQKDFFQVITLSEWGNITWILRIRSLEFSLFNLPEDLPVG